jgi:hypothetical protein
LILHQNSASEKPNRISGLVLMGSGTGALMRFLSWRRGKAHPAGAVSMAWLTLTRTALKILSGLMGIIAAVLWFMSASGEIPLAPGAEIGGTLPSDPFNVALRHSARLNQWAAGATGVSVLLMVLAEWSSWRIKLGGEGRDPPHGENL